MKLNLLKCAFGVESGKFLGFMVNMVNQHGIEANTEKIKALLEKEKLYLYLVVSEEAISTALVKEKEKV